MNVSKKILIKIKSNLKINKYFSNARIKSINIKANDKHGFK